MQVFCGRESVEGNWQVFLVGCPVFSMPLWFRRPRRPSPSRNKTFPRTLGEWIVSFRGQRSFCWCFKASPGGGNSNIFYVHPYLEQWSNLTNTFSNGLVQPPTRSCLVSMFIQFLVIIEQIQTLKIHQLNLMACRGNSTGGPGSGLRGRLRIMVQVHCFGKIESYTCAPTKTL